MFLKSNLGLSRLSANFSRVSASDLVFLSRFSAIGLIISNLLRTGFVLFSVYAIKSWFVKTFRKFELVKSFYSQVLFHGFYIPFLNLSRFSAIGLVLFKGCLQSGPVLLSVSAIKSWFVKTFCKFFKSFCIRSCFLVKIFCNRSYISNLLRSGSDLSSCSTIRSWFVEALCDLVPVNQVFLQSGLVL